MKKNSQILLLCFALFGFTTLLAQVTNTVRPEEFSSALKNPFKGFKGGVNTYQSGEIENSEKDTLVSLVGHYISWRAIEQNETDGFEKIVEYCNQHWGRYEEYNIKVIPRIFIDWNYEEGNEYWPEDILTQTGLPPASSELWRHPIVKDRIKKLIIKLGKAWDNDPRVAWVQTGIVGYWGEQENPVGVGEEDWNIILGDAFETAFPNKKLVVRNQYIWDRVGHKWGVYWDSFGHPKQAPYAGGDIKQKNAEGRYLTEVVEGEVAYNWGIEGDFMNLYGGYWNQDLNEGQGGYDGSPTITLGNDDYTDNMIDAIKTYHATGLSWIANYSLDGSHDTDPEAVQSNANRMHKEFGYRFLLPEFSSASRANQGGTLDLNFQVKNVGSAPIYEHWPVAFVLIDEETKNIVWQQVLSGIDITLWEPGSNYDKNDRAYKNLPRTYTFNATITIPNHIDTGQYMAGLSILEPNSQSPGVFFAVKNFLKESQSQPLCRIGIGEDLIGDYQINPSIFDNPVRDDNRTYAMESKVSLYELTSIASDGGSIKPKGGNFHLGSTITITASPDFGYEFFGWSDDDVDSDDANPVRQIIMNENKNVTANFSFLGGVAVNCGGETYTSAEGISYSADINFIGGNRYEDKEASITGTTDGFLHQSERWGASFSYYVDLPNDSYEVTLQFAEIYFNSSQSRQFDVEIEGSQVISDLDIFAVVGKNVVYSETHRVEVSDGQLNIVFTGKRDNAKISAIKIAKVQPVLSSAENLKMSEGIKVYPNPLSHKLYIDYDNFSEVNEIRIFSLSGQLLYSKKPIGKKTEISTKEINLKGLVIVQVVSREKVSNFKVVIN